MVHVGMPSAGRGAANVRCPKFSVCVCVPVRLYARLEQSGGIWS